MARSKHPRLVNYIHKYLVFFDVLRGFKGRERKPSLGENKHFIQRKMKSFILLFEDLKAVTKKQK